MRISRILALTFSPLTLVTLGGATFGQGSQHALELDGDLDRIRFQVDDDASGDASTIADVGAADFTLELWLRGELFDNPTSHAGGDVELAESAWLGGNVVLDRSAAGTGRVFGVSVAGGFVRFGTGTGDGGGAEAGHTLEGNTPVLDGDWHHIAAVREATSGEKRIYVDGLLDIASSPGVSTVDLSYPDEGIGGSLENPWLYVGGSKPRGGGAPASFEGFVDELRLWSRAHVEETQLSWFDRVVVPIWPELSADYRFEEGVGGVTKSHAQTIAPDGELVGSPTWTSYFANTAATAPITSGLLPRGFHRERVFAGLVETTSLTVLPDGTFLLAERAGIVHHLVNGVATPILTLATDTTSIEWGIVGMVLDPSFATNGWFYVHYTSTVPRDRVSRFTMTGGTVDPLSEVILWENPALGPGHTGGSMSFGPDGRLYIPTGDGFFPPNSQDLTNLNGKIIRINPDGTIPADNPGVSIPGAEPAIWAWGLRNPFRSGWDLPSGVFWIGDVGGDDNEAYEELHHGKVGENYGWPDMEGPDCVIADCTGMTEPLFSYKHDDPEVAPTMITGSVTAGFVYHGTAFPSEYQGDYFFGDYASRWMRRLRLDANGDIIDAPVFIPVLLSGTLVELVEHPNGDLYYLTVGLPWAGGPDDPAVYRVAYTDDSDPTPLSTVVVDTDPSGLLAYVDGYPVQTPYAFETRAGYQHEIGVDLFQVDPGTGQTISFLCWSDGLAATHEVLAPTGGANITAGFGLAGAVCDDTCGFDTYGHDKRGANTLGLIGGEGAGIGQTMVTKTVGLESGSTVFVGVALNDWDFDILGGTVLIDSFTQFGTIVLGEVGGQAVWSVDLPSTPGLAGADFYLQSLATDSGSASGFAFSNGLRVNLCP